VQIETFEQLIKIGAGRQFTVSKAHQRKARKRCGYGKKNRNRNKMTIFVKMKYYDTLE